MNVLVVALIGYLIGSISFSYLITKKIMKIDIREHGSGNAGATNTLRVLGVGPAILVLLLDALKGVAAVFVSLALGAEDWIPFIAGLFAIIGHNWPVYYGFKGGKGVATTIGVFAILVFYPALVAGAIAIITIILTRYVSLGSLLLMVFTPIFSIFIGDYPLSYIMIASIIGLLSIWRHRTNIKRLLKGEENKIGKTKDINTSKS